MLTQLEAEVHAASLEVNPALQLLAGERVTTMPRLSLEDSLAFAVEAEQLLDRLACIDREALETQDWVTAAVLEHQLQLSVDFAPFHDLRFDVTPYSLGLLASSVLPAALLTAPLQTSEDVTTYLGLLDEIGRYFETLDRNLLRQMEREIYMPRPALPAARALLGSLQGQVPALITVAPERLEALDTTQRERLVNGTTTRLDGRISPALASLASRFDAAYEEAAPEALGLGQYPNGADYYRFLVRRDTSLSLTPEEIHARGLELVDALAERKAVLRKQLGHEGDAASFHAALRADPRFYDETPEAVAERYNRYVRAIEPRISEQFSRTPSAPFEVLRADPAAEAGITFGYYQPPATPGAVGRYRFNGSTLEQRPSLWAGALIYHEGVPGHHFQIALAQESETLSAYRKGLFVGAFAEGWANFASTLAWEMGLLDDPWDEYGWLLFDSFSSARLVVDTGLNHLGWSFDRAAEYLRQHTMASEAEIQTELVRYGSALPAQALGYKLGEQHVLNLRNQVRDHEGADWDPRRFHDRVLSYGMLPLPVLSAAVKRAHGVP
ncbi:MAG: DUF885 domain-containing protein [Pseudomonadota bacterium]